ncbi:hypothetical protein AB0948_17085 [Streptomyces koyangensis]|uniref:hypothetical protein n=1 Tax=Streptomyces koyangensis TaxID=188770 RepID=UPI00345187A1
MGGEVGHVCFAGDGDCGPEGFLGLSGEGGVRLVEGAERRAVGELGPEDGAEMLPRMVAPRVPPNS